MGPAGSVAVCRKIQSTRMSYASAYGPAPSFVACANGAIYGKRDSNNAPV